MGGDLFDGASVNSKMELKNSAKKEGARKVRECVAAGFCSSMHKREFLTDARMKMKKQILCSICAASPLQSLFYLVQTLLL